MKEFKMENRALIDTINEIIERADECKAQANNEFEKGRLLAFNEVLSIIKTDFVGDEEIEKLLNLDVDKRYG